MSEKGEGCGSWRGRDNETVRKGPLTGGEKSEHPGGNKGGDKDA